MHESVDNREEYSSCRQEAQCPSLGCPCGYKLGAVQVLALIVPAATGTTPAKQQTSDEVACHLEFILQGHRKTTGWAIH